MKKIMKFPERFMCFDVFWAKLYEMDFFIIVIDHSGFIVSNMGSIKTKEAEHIKLCRLLSLNIKNLPGSNPSIFFNNYYIVLPLVNSGSSSYQLSGC